MDVQLDVFWHSIITFSIVAGLLILESGYYQYLINILSIHSREQKVKALLRHAITRYKKIPNFRQRIENDSWCYYNLGYTLLFGLLKSIFMLLVLLILMVSIVKSPLTLSLVAVYVVVATVIGRYIAYPLIKINYDLQTLATDFRDTLCLSKFSELNMLNKIWATKTKLINLFQALFGQASVIIPYLLLSHQYFTGHISFGVLMAAGSLVGQVINDAGWLLGQQDQVNNFYSCRNRLKELETA